MSKKIKFLKKDNVSHETSNSKVIKYGYKDWFLTRLKEAIAMLVVAFLWMLRLTFIPSVLFVGATWFSTRIIPSLAVQVFSITPLKTDSSLMDQFAFFYLPMISFVFIFGIVIVVIVCYTEYVFWKKTRQWLKYWFKKTNVKIPFKKLENNEV